MYYNENSWVFLDGKLTKASEAATGLFGQTLHYGNGVFEGIRSYQTEDGVRIFKAREHLERLLFSAEKMHFTVPYSVSQLENFCYRLLEKNNLSNAYLRPLAFLDKNMSLTSESKVNLSIMAWEWKKYLGDDLLRVMLSSYKRPHPQSCHVEAKVCGHYVNSILATMEAKKQGYDDALLTDHNGFVAEASGANFFFEKNGVFFTAPTGNILPGITRATVMELASELGIEVKEKYFLPSEILNADAAFFCGTAVEITGLYSFNDYVFPLKWEESSGYLLQKKYKKHVSVNEHRELFI